MRNVGCNAYKTDFIYPRKEKLNELKDTINYRKFIKIYNEKLKKMPKIERDVYLSNKSINPCLYGKVAIAGNGDIMPCLNAKNHVLGNINSQSISEILKDGLLDRYWYSVKDIIEDCKYCEFRYGCRDCLFLTHEFKNDKISKNIFCNYNPYKGIWKEL